MQVSKWDLFHKFYSPTREKNLLQCPSLSTLSLVAQLVVAPNWYLGGLDTIPVEAWIFSRFFSAIATSLEMVLALFHFQFTDQMKVT